MHRLTQENSELTCRVDKLGSTLESALVEHRDTVQRLTQDNSELTCRVNKLSSALETGLAEHRDTEQRLTQDTSELTCRVQRLQDRVEKDSERHEGMLTTLFQDKGHWDMQLTAQQLLIDSLEQEHLRLQATIAALQKELAELHTATPPAASLQGEDGPHVSERVAGLAHRLAACETFMHQAAAVQGCVTGVETLQASFARELACLTATVASHGKALTAQGKGIHSAHVQDLLARLATLEIAAQRPSPGHAIPTASPHQNPPASRPP